MPANKPFEELLRDVRGGDPAAAAEIVRRYESAIRVAVRTRLSDPALRQQFDSMDICQSVLASFFLRAAAGQYDLHDPQQLVALLTKIAHNKLAMHARNQYRQRRNVRRTRGLTNSMDKLPASSSEPAEVAADRDLIHQAYARMDPQVRQMATARANGAEWGEIAAELGGTAEACRKQFRRAMDAIAHTLHIE